jgi:gamma-glutamylcyclotransferase (GGCT)/AIG2-like uncharacterized protein YtfP
MHDGGPYLFVYGTLRSDSGHPMAAFLTARTTPLGQGTAAGRLYDLGPYPGMTAAESSADLVRGDVYELLDADATLAALDDYEGCSPPAPPPGLYERVLTSALLASGETLPVSAYVYRGPLDRARHLPSGEYPSAS